MRDENRFAGFTNEDLRRRLEQIKEDSPYSIASLFKRAAIVLESVLLFSPFLAVKSGTNETRIYEGKKMRRHGLVGKSLRRWRAAKFEFLDRCEESESFRTTVLLLKGAFVAVALFSALRFGINEITSRNLHQLGQQHAEKSLTQDNASLLFPQP
jgi:hypothetical protein